MKIPHHITLNEFSLSIRVAFTLSSLILLTACGSLSGVAKHNVENAARLAKDGSGISYGIWLNGGTEDIEAVKTVCKAIDNVDSRCATPEKYRLGNVASAFGFASGLAGVLTLKPVDVVVKPCVTGSSNCTYVKVKKVKAEPNKLGHILEVVSLPNESKCHWSGLARAGGVVCPSYDWDYRKNLSNWDTTNGEMTVR